MGIPLNDEGSELKEHPDEDYIKTIRTQGRDIPAAIISLGKTGVVLFTETCSISQMKELSDNILKAAQIDPSKRLIFATVNSREELEVHIRNSRGDDYASSCAIAAAASVVNGFLDRSATIIHKEGEFYFQWLHPSNEIFITGSADYIYSGSIFIDN
jgi:diaminopimelate epimerase